AFKDYYRRATQVSYSRVYKFLLSLVSPTMVISRAPSVWRKQHDSGELLVDEVRDSFARGHVTDDPCAVDVDYSLVLVANMEAMMGLAGTRPLKDDQRVLPNDVLELTLSWTPR